MSEPEPSKGKPFPVFKTDEEAEHFLETADLSEYDFSGFRRGHFEFRNKDSRVNMRMPHALLSAIKIAAAEEKAPYQRYMRELIEQGLDARKQRQQGVKKKAS